MRFLIREVPLYAVAKEQSHEEATAPVVSFKAPNTITSIQCQSAVVCVACEGGAVCILSAPFLAV